MSIYEINIAPSPDDFLEWLEDVFNIRLFSLSKLKQYSQFFLAYVSHIRANNIADTKSFRKKWFFSMKDEILRTSMYDSGI